MRIKDFKNSFIFWNNLAKDSKYNLDDLADDRGFFFCVIYHLKREDFILCKPGTIN